MESMDLDKAHHKVFTGEVIQKGLNSTISEHLKAEIIQNVKLQKLRCRLITIAAMHGSYNTWECWHDLDAELSFSGTNCI
ncbi:unnamed protein product [Urochloa humidicola]